MKSNAESNVTGVPAADPKDSLQRRVYEEPTLTVEPLHKAILASFPPAGDDGLGGSSTVIT